MTHILAEKITKYLIKNQVGEANSEAMYIYGIEIMIEKFIIYSTLLVCALYLKLLIPSILFILFFVLLRGYTGGFHASTFIGCLTGSILMYMVCTLILAPIMLDNEVFLLLGLIITVAVILMFSPMNHPNINMNMEEFNNCKDKTKVILVLEIVFLTGGRIFKLNQLYIVLPFLGMLMCAVLLVLAKIIKQEVKMYEDI